MSDSQVPDLWIGRSDIPPDVKAHLMEELEVLESLFGLIERLMQVGECRIADGFCFEHKCPADTSDDDGPDNCPHAVAKKLIAGVKLIDLEVELKNG